MRTLVSAAAFLLAAALPCQEQLEVKTTDSGFANEPQPVAERFEDRVVVKFKVPYTVATLDTALEAVGLRRLATGYAGAFEGSHDIAGHDRGAGEVTGSRRCQRKSRHTQVSK